MLFQSRKLYPPPPTHPQEGFFYLSLPLNSPNPSGNSSFTLYFPLKMLAFETPTPLGNSYDLSREWGIWILPIRKRPTKHSLRAKKKVPVTMKQSYHLMRQLLGRVPLYISLEGYSEDDVINCKLLPTGV